MSIKVKQGLQQCFLQISNKTFDEQTIRILLILIREHFPDNSLLKELAHFVAHPDRNKGIFHKKVNNRYTKWKLTEDQVQKIPDNKTFLEDIKTEDELSDFLLSGVNVEKIAVQIFEIIYVDGLEDISEKHLKKYTGLTRNEAREKLKKYYKKNEGFYTLNREAILSEFKQIFYKRYNISQFGDELVEEVEQYFSKSEDVAKYIDGIIEKLDQLEKVIRGTIEFGSVFRSIDLFDEISKMASGIVTEFNLDRNFIGAIRKNREDILLCLMTLLHDAKFLFYDKNVARVFLCIYLDPPKYFTEEKFKEWNTMEYHYQHSVLALYITYNIGNKVRSFPLFVSDLKIKHFVSVDEFSQFREGYDGTLQPIPWITAYRNQDILTLTV